MTTSKDIVSSLRKSMIFKDSPEKLLAEIAKKFKPKSFRSGDVMLKMDEKPDKVYVIVKGRVKVTRPTNYGDETILNVLDQGNLVGELSVIDHLTRSAKVTCMEDTETLMIGSKEFTKILESHVPVGNSLMEELCRRIRVGNDNVVRRLEEQHDAIHGQFEKLHELIEASKIINSTLNLDDLLGLILNTAVKNIRADRGTLYLMDDAKQELWSKVLQGTELVEIRLPLGTGIAGHVAKTGEIINIEDAYNDPHFNPDFDKQTGYHTQTMLTMPMRNKDGKIIGVFQILNKKEGVFERSDEQYIEALSAHASVAIENARLAQQMVQSERLSAVGRMASTIIHDIKNPMSTLRVYAQVMKKKSGNEEAGKLADEMIRQVDRFVAMTQEILDFTRGVSSLNKTSVAFEEVMESVLNFIEKDLSKNNVKLVRDTQFKGKVNLDEDKIIRVFYNIASNARDAMPEGGELRVATLRQNGFVMIDFKDTGSGMPDEVKKKLFEPFVTHGKKHGTGLGMAIVKKVIDDHKGKIEIESELGKGTSIRIYLPAD